jgi:hypothetical protein
MDELNKRPKNGTTIEMIYERIYPINLSVCIIFVEVFYKLEYPYFPTRDAQNEIELR